MYSRRWVAFALLAALAGPPGCNQDRSLTPPVGGLDVVIRATDDARMLGTLSVRRDDGRVVWRLPVRAEGYRTRRVVLVPGMYGLDFEADMSAVLAGAEGPLRLRPSALPRWVVVAPARVTVVNVTTEVEANAPSVAAMRDALPSPTVDVN